MNIDLEDNELVFTFEVGSVKRIPLGSLLVGMASEQWVNAKLDNYYNKGEVDGLLGAKVNTSDIVDNLNSTDTNKPLSANQGKVLNDTTAKLAVSNVFTQPQQVPNATLPQHTVNKLQVETMFEMFKRELRGYNLGKPDLTGKTDLGDGWYQIQLGANYDRRYNVYSGEWYMNGFFPSLFAGNEEIVFEIDKLQDYVLTPVLISGTHNSTYDFIFRSSSQLFMPINSEQSRNINNSTFLQWRSNVDGLMYDNAIIKFQLEKGTEATPYTVPGQIPQYKIVGEE